MDWRPSSEPRYATKRYAKVTKSLGFAAFLKWHQATLTRQKQRKYEDDFDHPSKRRNVTGTKASGSAAKKPLAIRSPPSEKRTKKTTKNENRKERDSGKRSAAVPTENRRSGRTTGRKSYAEGGDSEDDEIDEGVGAKKQAADDDQSDDAASDAGNES